MGSMVALTMFVDRAGTLWLGGNSGVIRRTADGKFTKFDAHDGLPDAAVRALWMDRDGNLWAGTNNGVARLEAGRFAAAAGEDAGQMIRCLLEDREGNLWIGANGGL